MKSRNTRCNGRRSKSKCQRRKAARCRADRSVQDRLIRLIQLTNLQPRNFRRRSTTCRSKACKRSFSDLRNNPGGLLNSAVDVCAHFCRPTQKWSRRRGGSSPSSMITRLPARKKERPNSRWCCDQRRKRERGGIVCWSAQGFAPGRAVGETTFGKGSVKMSCNCRTVRACVTWHTRITRDQDANSVDSEIFVLH